MNMLIDKKFKKLKNFSLQTDVDDKEVESLKYDI